MHECISISEIYFASYVTIQCLVTGQLAVITSRRQPARGHQTKCNKKA